MIEVQLAFTQPQKVRNLKSHRSGGFLDVLPEEKIKTLFSALSLVFRRALKR